MEGLLSNDSEEEFVVYKTRWTVLCTFSLLTFTNGFLWLSFSPITSLTKEYFNVSNSVADLFTIIYSIAYFPGVLLSPLLISMYGTYSACVFTGILNLTCSICRVLAVISPEVSGYVFILIGQCLGGLVQPICLALPPRIAGDWFGSNERDTSTAISAVANLAGVGIGQLIPSLLIHADSSGKVNGFSYFSIVSIVLSLVSLLCVCLLFKSTPPTPPSRSSLYSIGKGDRGNLTVFLADSKQLLADTQFWILLLGFGMSVGSFNCVMSLILDVVAPAGYDSDDAGVFGAVCILTGILGALLVGILMDCTHAYRTILKGVSFSVLCLAILLFFNIKPENTSLLTVCFALLGCMGIPLFPLILELGAELSYPIPEDVSSTYLMLSVNTFGVVYMFIGQWLLNSYQQDFSTVYTPFAVVMVATVFLAVLAFWMYSGDYKRLKAEASKPRTPSIG